MTVHNPAKSSPGSRLENASGINGGLPVTIHPPSERERKACRMLIPEAFRWQAPAKALIAVIPDPLTFIGAAAGQVVVRARRREWLIWIRTIEPRRRQGIGTALLDRISSYAPRFQTESVVFEFDGTKSPEAVAFLTHRGIDHHSSVTVFESPLEAFVGFLSPLRERLWARNGLGDGTRLVPLSEAPIRQVIGLYRRRIQSLPEARDLNVDRSSYRALLNPCSVVLMDGDRIAAMMLVRIKEDTAVVEARVVGEDYRGRWANALIMAEGLEEALKLGLSRVQFSSTAANKDTMKLAKRCAARVVRRKDLFSRPVPTD